MLIWPLDGVNPLLLLLCLHQEVQIENGDAPRGNFLSVERAHHEHHPNRLLPLPVGGDGSEKVFGVEAFFSLNNGLMYITESFASVFQKCFAILHLTH